MNIEDERKSILELVQMIPIPAESLDLVVSEKILEGPCDGLLHFNFYLGAQGNDFQTVPFRATHYDRNEMISPFSAEGFVEAYLRALNTAKSTLYELFYETEQEEARIVDQTYFGELLYRHVVSERLFVILSGEIDLDKLMLLEATLADPGLKATLVAGCENFSAALEMKRSDNTPPILRSNTVRYIHENDRSSIIPFTISDNL